MLRGPSGSVNTMAGRRYGQLGSWTVWQLHAGCCRCKLGSAVVAHRGIEAGRGDQLGEEGSRVGCAGNAVRIKARFRGAYYLPEGL